MTTEIINNISGKEFYEIVLGEDSTINSEERLEEQFGNLYKHLTNNIWCAKTKYKGSRVQTTVYSKSNWNLEKRFMFFKNVN